MGMLMPLVRTDDFAAVRRRGARTHSGPIVVSMLSSTRRRLGIVITRHIGTAVQRNRIRRVVREFMRTSCASAPQGDCVVVPREGAATLTNEELRRHLVICFEALAARKGE